MAKPPLARARPSRKPPVSITLAAMPGMPAPSMRRPPPSAPSMLAATMRPVRPRVDKRHTTPHPTLAGRAMSGRLMAGPAPTVAAIKAAPHPSMMPKPPRAMRPPMPPSPLPASPMMGGSIPGMSPGPSLTPASYDMGRKRNF